MTLNKLIIAVLGIFLFSFFLFFFNRDIFFCLTVALTGFYFVQQSDRRENIRGKNYTNIWHLMSLLCAQDIMYHGEPTVTGGLIIHIL